MKLLPFLKEKKIAFIFRIQMPSISYEPIQTPIKNINELDWRVSSDLGGYGWGIEEGKFPKNNEDKLKKINLFQ